MKIDFSKPWYQRLFFVRRKRPTKNEVIADLRAQLDVTKVTLKDRNAHLEFLIMLLGKASQPGSKLSSFVTKHFEPAYLLIERIRKSDPDEPLFQAMVSIKIYAPIAGNEKNVVLGHVVIKLYSENIARFGYIHISPPYRNMGIGTILMNKLCQLVQKYRIVISESVIAVEQEYANMERLSDFFSQFFTIVTVDETSITLGNCRSYGMLNRKVC